MSNEGLRLSSRLRPGLGPCPNHLRLAGPPFHPESGVFSLAFQSFHANHFSCVILFSTPHAVCKVLGPYTLRAPLQAGTVRATTLTPTSFVHPLVLKVSPFGGSPQSNPYITRAVSKSR